MYFFKEPAPPYSPDLNQIEHVWSDMKTHIASKFFETVEQVENAIAEYARNLTVEKCRRFIFKLHEVIFISTFN